MPIDIFFTSKGKCNDAGFPKRKQELKTDLDERDKLFALPFNEQRKEYNHIWDLKKQGIKVSRGQFLFWMDILKRQNIKCMGVDVYDKRYSRYCTGNVLSGAYSTQRNSDPGHGANPRHAHGQWRPKGPPRKLG